MKRSATSTNFTKLQLDDICANLDHDYRLSDLQAIAQDMNIDLEYSSAQLKEKLRTALVHWNEITEAGSNQAREAMIAVSFTDLVAQRIIAANRDNRIQLRLRGQITVGDSDFDELPKSRQRTVAGFYGIGSRKTKAELCAEIAKRINSNKTSRKLEF